MNRRIELSVFSNVEPLLPREFIKLVVAASQNLSPTEVIKLETTRKYIRDSVSILSQVLGVDKRTPYKWGNSLNFEEIPEHHKIALGYAKAAHIHKNFAVSIADGLYDVPVIEAGEFLEDVFGLSNLSKKQALKAVSNPAFRCKCKKVLAFILRLNERTVDSWGTDMYFDKMPEKYQAVLGYALAAAKTPIKADFFDMAA